MQLCGVDGTSEQFVSTIMDDPGVKQEKPKKFTARDQLRCLGFTNIVSLHNVVNI